MHILCTCFFGWLQRNYTDSRKNRKHFENKSLIVYILELLFGVIETAWNKHTHNMKCRIVAFTALILLKQIFCIVKKESNKHLHHCYILTYEWIVIFLPMSGSSSMVMPWDLRCFLMQASRCTLGPQRLPSLWMCWLCVTKRISSFSLHSGLQSGGGITVHIPYFSTWARMDSI